MQQPLAGRARGDPPARAVARGADDDHRRVLGLGDVVEPVRRRAGADHAVLGRDAALVEEALRARADLLAPARACSADPLGVDAPDADRVLLRVDGDDEQRLAGRARQLRAQDGGVVAGVRPVVADDDASWLLDRRRSAICSRECLRP